MASRVQIKPGLLKRMRDVHGIPSEVHQARLLGVDRTTLRRIDKGGEPSPKFMAAMWETFGLGLGEAFELVEEKSLGEQLQAAEAPQEHDAAVAA